jgi:hypothetical protein
MSDQLTQFEEYNQFTERKTKKKQKILLESVSKWGAKREN